MHRHLMGNILNLYLIHAPDAITNFSLFASFHLFCNYQSISLALVDFFFDIYAPINRIYSYTMIISSGIAQAILCNLAPWQEYDVKNILQHGTSMRI